MGIPTYSKSSPRVAIESSYQPWQLPIGSLAVPCALAALHELPLPEAGKRNDMGRNLEDATIICYMS